MNKYVFEATFQAILLPSLRHDGRSNSRNVASLNILDYDVIDLLCYEVYLFGIFKINLFLTISLNNDDGQVYLVSLFRNYIRSYFASKCYLNF